MGEAIGVVAAIGASALVIQKVVEFARNAFDGNGVVKTYWWNALALVLGVAYAVGWQINLAAGLVALVPALAGSSHLTGVSGQVVTGLAVGAAAGFWHGVFELLESTSKREAAVTVVPAPKTK